jgi:hypothetical protein
VPKTTKISSLGSEDLDLYGGKVEANELFEDCFVGQENGSEQCLFSLLR